MRDSYGDAKAATQKGENLADLVIAAISKVRNALTESQIQILKIEDAAPNEDDYRDGTRLKVELYVASDSSLLRLSAPKS